MSDVKFEHTFVICAYKESPFLSKCVKSLLAQSVKSQIIMVTSTPNEHIAGVAKEYDIPLFINEGVAGISGDWNFGISCAKTQYVTIAHQDDIYEPDYTKITLDRMKKRTDSIIAFTDYGEIRAGKKTDYNTLLKVKRIMLWPLGISIFGKQLFEGSRFVRRRILSMGNPVSCPSVMYNLKNINLPIFVVGMKSNVDWEAWEILSRQKGSFIYVKNRLTYHRIHGGSTTSQLIAINERSVEDYAMFCKFWPKPIARLIMRWYSDSQKSNTL